MTDINTGGDIRSQFCLSQTFSGFGEADRAAKKIASLNPSIVSLGDMQKLSLKELRGVMEKSGLSPRRQGVFVNQLYASHILLRGMTKREDFGLQ